MFTILNRPSVWMGEELLMPSPSPLVEVERFCQWCPYIMWNGKIRLQTMEQGRECIFENDSCWNGRAKCLADENGKESCVLGPEIEDVLS